MSRQSIENGSFGFEPKPPMEPEIIPVDERAFYIQQKIAEIKGTSAHMHFIDGYTNPFDGITPAQNGGISHQDQRAKRAAAHMVHSIQTEFGVDDYQDPYLAEEEPINVADIPRK